MAKILSIDTTHPDRITQLPNWLTRHLLAIAAIVAWLGTIVGFMLGRIESVGETVLLTFFVIAYIFGGTLATRDAARDLLDRHVNIDLLMILAATGAAVLGQWLEGAILLSLFSTSNALEHYSMNRTRNAVHALMDLTPPTARIVRNGGYETIDVSEIIIGDIVLIQPGERIPVDGHVVEGQSTVDQAAITGESVPVGKTIGDEVFSGTINGNGSLRAEVSKLAADSTLARIVRLVSDAQEDQSELQEFAEGFEGKYAVFVILFSTLVTLLPMAFGVPGGDAFYRGMTLLVVMSPCALVISTPAATLSALANAARKGILVKGGRAMDMLGSVDIVAFDKTGTLTIGKPVLTDVITIGSTDPDWLLATAAAAEQLSEHPIGDAIVVAAQRDGLDLPLARDLEAVPGHGLISLVNGQRITIGNIQLMRNLGYDLPDSVISNQQVLSDEGKSTMFVATESGVIGLLAVADVIRPEVARTLQELKQAGVKRTVMLTGDNFRVANAIAAQIGLDEIQADLLPEDKLEVISALRKQGKVGMIGDGVNDAPALARADIGIAMGSIGTDAALETADVVLMSDDLSRVGYAIGLSRKMRRIITMNLSFAIGVIAVLATANLLVGIPLPLGVIGHEGSTVIVILNGLRLLGYGGSWSDLVKRQISTEVVEVPQYRVTGV